MSAHVRCDCVPTLGPAHCHGCSALTGSETLWNEQLCGLLEKAARDAALLARIGEYVAIAPAEAANPFFYDPYEDDSVDPSNTDEVVRAAVGEGWSAGADTAKIAVRKILNGAS